MKNINLSNVYILVLILSFYLINSKRNNPNQVHKGQSRLERKYIECQSTPRCTSRINDEECIYKCMNEECYNELIIKKNFLLEFGEINKEFRKAFDDCCNKGKKILNK